MDTTINQQVARDEALVPHAKRLRIGRSNFRLLSDIKSKESTLQLVYDALRLTPFFKAFLVTADFSEIYMQEFWATATIHHHSIRFKMDNKKHIVNLEPFKEMLHIFPRLPHQPFVEPPFEEEILAFLCFLGHSAVIKKLTDVNINKLHQPWRSFDAIINKCLTKKSSGYDSLRLSQAQILWGLYHKRNVDFAYLMWEDFVYQVEHKDTKKSNEKYYPRFTKVIIHHFMPKDPLIPRRNKFGALLPIELTNKDIKNSNAYKEYYAVAIGVTPPKHKASVRKTRSSSNTTITPLTTAAGPRLTTFEKGKQEAKASQAKSLSALSEVAMTKTQQLKLATKRSLQQIHISQASGSSVDEGTGSIPGVLDVPTDESEEELSWNSTDEEGKDGDGDDDDDGDDGHDEEEEEDKLYIDVNINQGRGIQMTQEVEDLHVTLTSINPDGQAVEFIRRMNEAVKVAVQLQSDRLRDEAQADNDEFLKTIDENMQKIIKEQVKEQVKALVDAYESDKIILDTYGDTVTLKRRRADDADKDEEPSAGLDRGSKRRREGKEPESGSAPTEIATKSAGRSTQGSRSRQTSASESATVEEPMQTTFEMEEPSHLEFETGADDQPIVQSS
nr:hypothetical protein [Tanacetum cinerariifolium]